MGKQAATTKKSQSAKHNPEDQVRAFRKAARELGCDDNEDRFKAALRAVGKAKPQPPQEPKRRAKGR